jgi:predicted glycogen debranching enzyme
MPNTKLTYKTGNLVRRALSFGRSICGELSSAEATEWLVTNGIGGYASGTVANLLTRRYHGLLIAALKAPLGRTLLVSKLDETIEYNGQVHRIFTNRWGNVLVEPHGYRDIERFRLEGATPSWTYSFGDARLEKRIWMQPGENTTYVFYSLPQAMAPLSLSVRPLVNYRDFHGQTYAGNWVMQVKRVKHGLWISAFEEAVPFLVLSDQAVVNQEHHWYRNFSLSKEQHDGFAVMEDHLNVGEFRITLAPGGSVTFVISTETAPNLDGASALAERQAYEAKLQAFAPDMPAQLLLAADQFIVKRADLGQEDGRSIIAGYPWLRDWARDTLISLPGLTLATGRQNEARSLLKTFARYANEGMLPSCFPEAGEVPEYKTVDVTLWYFEAIRAYYQETGDKALLGELFPILAEIVDWHIRGTGHNIHVDDVDGLLYAGEAGVPLTWMDSRWDNWVVTPRIGKPVEINALWYNALCSMAEFACSLDQTPKYYEKLAKRTRASFARFWNNELGFCFDVLDGPQGNEATLRPNQLLAVSLHHSPLGRVRQKAVVDICARRLLIPMGLRSLAQNEPGYVGSYGGNAQQQLGAYHQGMAWGWLIGPFISAHLRVYQQPHVARVFLEPFLDHLSVHGVGSVSELFDGEPPYTSRGCIAQAWSVAELLRAWREVYPKNASANSIKDAAPAP